MAAATFGSTLASSTVVAAEPIALIARRQFASSFEVGCSVAVSTTTRRVRRHARNLRLSPSSTALLTIGQCAFTWSSMRTGGTFSPPAVMMSSLMRPVIASSWSPDPSAHGKNLPRSPERRKRDASKVSADFSGLLR